MFLTLPKLPNGGLTHIANELGVSIGAVWYWQQRGIPYERRKQIETILADMDITPHGLNNLPRGGLGKVAMKLGKPYTTVCNWKNYRIPDESREEVKRVLRELGYD